MAARITASDCGTDGAVRRASLAGVAHRQPGCERDHVWPASLLIEAVTPHRDRVIGPHRSLPVQERRRRAGYLG